MCSVYKTLDDNKYNSLVFPLCLLIETNTELMLRNIFCYGIMAIVERRQLDYDFQMELRKSFEYVDEDRHRGFEYIIQKAIVRQKKRPFARDYDSSDSIHNMALTAIDGLGFSAEHFAVTQLGSLSEFKATYLKAKAFQKEYEEMYNPDAICQTHIDLLIDVVDGELAIEDFRVLCGVSAILSRVKRFKRITSLRIYSAMNGYKSYKIMEVHSGDVTNIITDSETRVKTLKESERKKISRIVARLTRKTLLGTYSIGRRKYYSTYIHDRDELKNAVNAVLKKRAGEKSLELSDEDEIPIEVPFEMQ